MMKKLMDCEHCGGKKNCTASSGKSCYDCLAAAGKGRRAFSVVRCSYCGGRGKVWVEVPDEEAEGAEADGDATAEQ